MWKLGILKPIPKSSLTDPRTPLQYRGICLLSTVYKLFSRVLNERIVKVAEASTLYGDEQNGFRKGRACIDHIFVLASVIRNRKAKRLPTYVAYIDFEKAFDRIDRSLLVYKLITLGISGKILKCIKNIYHQCKCAVNVNGHITNWFSSDFGVRQGDTLSPTLFALFIDDLTAVMRENGKGVEIGDFSLQCLLYADDLVLISESEDDLQRMFNALHEWCAKWRMRINVSKSKVVHHRIKGHKETQFKFKLGDCNIDTVDRYKYLGVVLDSSLDFGVTAAVLAESAGRALGTIYSKFKSNKGLGYETYTKLYNSGVIPILDYCAGVWGFGNHDKINTVQNKAIRYYLGVHRFAPNLAINGDVGWYSSSTRRKVEMIRLWNRLQNMDNSRLTKKVFLWDKDLCTRNWSSDVKRISDEAGCLETFMDSVYIDVRMVKSRLHDKQCRKWCEEIVAVPKLRTYIKFKNQFFTEPFVKLVTNRRHRSAISQFRCGILPLSIETGRYLNIPENFRICLFCDEDEIETEAHFLLYCGKYATERQGFMVKVFSELPQFDNLAADEKLVVLMTEKLIKLTASFIWECLEIRSHTLYTSS